MNIMTTNTTLPHTGARGEPNGVSHSNGDDISPAAEHDPAAKNLVLPRRARCLGQSGESLNVDARQLHLCMPSLERGVHDGNRDSFRRQGCAGAHHSCHMRRHSGNSNRARRCSIRSQDHTVHFRPRVGDPPPHNRRPRHDWKRCQGYWKTSAWAKTTVSKPGTVGLRGVHDASTVIVSVPRRIVFQNGRRVLADSELDDDPWQAAAFSLAPCWNPTHTCAPPRPL
jgi:hypothetical protein